MVEKLLTALIKVVLVKNGQDKNVREYGFKRLVNKKQITTKAKKSVIS